MNFLKFPLDHQNSGTVVEVTLRGIESDVLLVNELNLRQFERGTGFNYIGGHYRGSPVRLQTPSSDTWTIVVIPSPGGTVHASVRVIATA